MAQRSGSPSPLPPIESEQRSPYLLLSLLIVACSTIAGAVWAFWFGDGKEDLRIIYAGAAAFAAAFISSVTLGILALIIAFVKKVLAAGRPPWFIATALAVPIVLPVVTWMLFRSSLERNDAEFAAVGAFFVGMGVGAFLIASGDERTEVLAELAQLAAPTPALGGQPTFGDDQKLRLQLVHECLAFEGSLTGEEQERRLRALSRYGPEAIANIVDGIEVRLLNDHFADGFSQVVRNATDLCNVIAEIGGPTCGRALIHLTRVFEDRFSGAIAHRCRQLLAKSSVSSKNHDCMTIAMAFVQTADWDLPAALERFSVTLAPNVGEKEPRQLHGAWIHVAEAAWNKKNLRLSAQCYLQALRAYPSLDSVAWSNLLMPDRADIRGVPQAVADGIKDIERAQGPYATDNPAKRAARVQLIEDAIKSVGVPGGKQSSERVVYTCPHCAARVGGPGNAVGKTATCPKCKQQFKLERNDSLSAGQ